MTTIQSRTSTTTFSISADEQSWLNSTGQIVSDVSALTQADTELDTFTFSIQASKTSSTSSGSSNFSLSDNGASSFGYNLAGCVDSSGLMSANFSFNQDASDSVSLTYQHGSKSPKTKSGTSDVTTNESGAYTSGVAAWSLSQSPTSTGNLKSIQVDALQTAEGYLGCSCRRSCRRPSR